MKLVKATNESIVDAAETIKSGGLVAFPTETVYGLGADGLNPIAVAKIFEVKKRPSFNPLILHIASIEQFKTIGNINNPKINDLISKFWPGPLTLVIPKNKIVPEIVTSGNTTVAIRMPNHPVALELIKKSNTPIAAPSANVFGKLSPTSAEHVVKQLGDKVEIILDGGKCQVGVESTILNVTEKDISLLRPGGLAVEDIESVIGKLKLEETFTDTPLAPGQLPYHYAPQTPLKFIGNENTVNIKNLRIGGLVLKKNIYDYEFTVVKVLSPSGDLREAAANLFSFLHEMENENLDLILVEPIQEIGLGKAIMDRLRKAEKKFG